MRVSAIWSRSRAYCEEEPRSTAHASFESSRYIVRTSRRLVLQPTLSQNSNRKYFQNDSCRRDTGTRPRPRRRAAAAPCGRSAAPVGEKNASKVGARVLFWRQSPFLSSSFPRFSFTKQKQKVFQHTNKMAFLNVDVSLSLSLSFPLSLFFLTL